MDFKPIEPMNASRECLDEAALHNGGVLCSVGYGYSTTNSTVRSQHGWRLRWIDRRGMGNHGTAVITPTDARTRALWIDGQMLYFRRAGVPEMYISRLVRLRLPYRHELAATIAACLRDYSLRDAIVDYDGGSIGKWRSKWLPVVDDIKLSGPRLIALGHILIGCTNAKNPPR